MNETNNLHCSRGLRIAKGVSCIINDLEGCLAILVERRMSALDVRPPVPSVLFVFRDILEATRNTQNSLTDTDI